MAGDKWDAALGRKTTIDDVVRYVIAHWIELQRGPKGNVDFEKPEPKITTFFGLSLDRNARRHGVFGMFVPEAPVAKVNDADKVLERVGRTDLLFHTDRLDPGLRVMFEFKKLKPGGKDLRRHYCTSGVLRFVNGVYGQGQDVGFMVGMIPSKLDEDKVIDSVKRTLQVADLARPLRLIADGRRRVVISPAALFPECAFETQHARDHVEDCPDMVLGHLFLCSTS